ncbi:hypothetical protein HMF8227_01582 [Saliniradius amylolyticus]|uniref:Ribosomal S4P (Gammaproteobacterial) n=1 Tax=Saliniradius amylolyticus TaxID=2183582 RepID=A0A2S2E323_9ALTE|nr:VC2046/SO_2500 family protein [Saliniradius amylolyticus]AWL12056.1 hypothetical protein HMF8227_01582 [Saliniradius amylolyticus]
MIPIIDSDIEFSGQLGQTLQQGHGSEFNLMLSMLMEDWLHRPRIEPSSDTPASDSVLAELSVAPQAALKAEPIHWSMEEKTGELVRQSQLSSARLWSAMHPCPMSLHNDPKHIDDEVMGNMSYPAQQRLKGQVDSSEVSQDATGLYEILQDLKPHSGLSQAA